MKMLHGLQNKDELQALGLMSGTSADGLDVAHVVIKPLKDQPQFSLKSFFTWQFPKEVKQLILNVAAPNGGTVEDVCQINFLLGHLFSNIVLDYLKSENIPPQSIDFIGSHGQTICHLPEKISAHGIQFASTLQIGDPSVIANRTGILTVGDFRTADMSLDGQGAPLIPIFDYLYFRHEKKNRVILNIGGIANITFLPPNCSPDQVIAFDTGPGNVLIDSLTKQFFDFQFDKDGLLARSGQLEKRLLDVLLNDEYFARQPPKSTGREKFAGPVLEKIRSYIENEKIQPENVLSTVTELTAITIYNACKDFLAPKDIIDELIISGGGSDNLFLRERIGRYFSETKMISSDDYGLKSDAKEATCFAILAYLTLWGFPSSIASVTGASRSTILGKICIPC